MKRVGSRYRKIGFPLFNSLLTEDLAGLFYDVVHVMLARLFCQVNLDIRIYAEFRVTSVLVIDGTSRIADVPTIGKAAVHGHSAAAASVVANDGDIREGSHDDGKIVGSTIYAPIGQHADALVPAEIARRFEPPLLHLREVLMACACLVLHISYEGAFLNEASCQAFGHRQLSAAIIANVNNQSTTEGKVPQQ